MIEALGMAGIIAILCIPAGLIGRVISKQIHRRERELRRQQAAKDMAEISALYQLSKKEGLIND